MGKQSKLSCNGSKDAHQSESEKDPSAYKVIIVNPNIYLQPQWVKQNVCFLLCNFKCSGLEWRCVTLGRAGGVGWHS